MQQKALSSAALAYTRSIRSHSDVWAGVDWDQNPEPGKSQENNICVCPLTFVFRAFADRCIACQTTLATARHETVVVHGIDVEGDKRSTNTTSNHRKGSRESNTRLSARFKTQPSISIDLASPLSPSFNRAVELRIRHSRLSYTSRFLATVIPITSKSSDSFSRSPMIYRPSSSTHRPPPSELRVIARTDRLVKRRETECTFRS